MWGEVDVDVSVGPIRALPASWSLTPVNVINGPCTWYGYSLRNPSGASSIYTTVSQIVLGATGVAAFSNNPFPVQQTITGGTVSAIAINGVNTGLTSGTFWVPAFGNVTVTYTGAPTTFTTAGVAPVSQVSGLAGISAAVDVMSGNLFLGRISVSGDIGNEEWYGPMGIYSPGGLQLVTVAGTWTGTVYAGYDR